MNLLSYKLLILLFNFTLLTCISTAQENQFEDPIPISLNEFGGTDGAGASEGFDFDNDGQVEFVSIASNSSNPAHFRIYDYNSDRTSFDIIELLSNDQVESRLDRFGGDIAWGDINGDGWVDIVVPDSNNSSNGAGGAVTWFENPKGSNPNNSIDQTWTEHTVSTWSGESGDDIAHMSEIDVGDINGDGVLDIVTRDIERGVFICLQENDRSGWQNRIFIATNPREGLDLFNPDGDEDLDIILNGVWLETPRDLFTENFTVHQYGAAWYPSGNSIAEQRDYACQIAVTDFNNDGREDIAISNSEELQNAFSTNGKPQGIRVYLAPVNPKTQPWTEIIAETEHFSWHSLEPIDINNDGFTDFISAISSVGADDAAPEINVYLNNFSDSSFKKETLNDANLFLYNATVGDYDGDGDQDLFSPNNFNSGPHYYFENGITLPPPATAPTNFIAEKRPILTIKLSWTDTTENETGFIIERREGNSAFIQLTTLPQNSSFFNDNMFPLESTLTYRIKATNGAGDSPYSQTFTVTTLPADTTPPSQVTNLTSSALSSTAVRLSWRASTDDHSPIYYNIFQDGSLISQTTFTTYNIINLQEDTSYDFAIEAVDFSGNLSPQSSIFFSTQNIPTIDNSFIAYWSLNEGAGVVARDQINAREASFSGSPSWIIDGRIGGGILIDDNSERLVTPHIDMPANELTVALWVYPISFDGNANEARFISKANSVTESDHDWMLGNFENGSALRFRIRNQSGSVTTLVSPENVLALNQWSHVAASYDGTTMRIFHNGSQIASQISEGIFSQNPNINIGIGNQPTGAGDRAIDGRIDEVYLYNRALNTSEIASLANVSEPDYDTWASVNFTSAELANPSISGNLADADGDGIANLLDFATESPIGSFADKNYPDLSNDLQFTYYRLAGGTNFTSARYHLGNLIYTIESSETLNSQDWQEASSLQFERLELIPLLGLEKVTFQPLFQDDRLFLRLSVIQE